VHGVATYVRGDDARRGACLVTDNATGQIRSAAPAAQATRPAQPANTVPVRVGTGQPTGQAAAANGAAPAAHVAAAGVAGQAEKLQVMAVVNGEQITRTDLGRECIRRYGEEVLESMVNRHLIAAACTARGIQITDADVSAEIDRISSRFGLARDRWLSLLQEERGFSEQQYRREVIWPMLALRQLAAEQIQVTQEELKKAFDSEYGPKVRARLIAVDSQQKAEQIRAAAVANPAQFGELSKQHSLDPGVAAAYGVIPPIRRNLGDAQLEQVAFSLQPGQISPVVKVANMYYILKCEEQIPAQVLPTPQLREQEQRLAEKIKENKLRVAAGEFFEQVQSQAQVVNVLNDPEKQKQMPGVAATVNGTTITLQQLAEECITRHGQDVLDGEINRKVLQQELKRRSATVDQPDIDAEVRRAADSFGFVTADGQPDVKRWLESVTESPGATVDLYVRDAVWPSVALKKLVGNRVEVTEEDLRRGFESNYGERVEALAIVLSDHRQAQKVWEMARNSPTDAVFADLALQYSVEPASRSNGGKVPPIRRHGGSPLIEEEAFKLKAGELSGIIAVDNQFVILRCLGRTKPVEVNFAEVKDELTKDIREKKLRVLMTREFDRLREAAQVDNFLTATSHAGARASVPSVLPATPATRPAATPGNAAAPRTASPQVR
jgi:parvulin-like peptidyl-prolyl isomerase